MSTTQILGLAVACLAACFMILAVLSWHQADQIKALGKRVKTIEDDRQEKKDSVLYTRPLRIQPDNRPGNAVPREGSRRARRVGGAKPPEVPPENTPDATVGGGE